LPDKFCLVKNVENFETLRWQTGDGRAGRAGGPAGVPKKCGRRFESGVKENRIGRGAPPILLK